VSIYKQLLEAIEDATRCVPHHLLYRNIMKLIGKLFAMALLVSCLVGPSIGLPTPTPDPDWTWYNPTTWPIFGDGHTRDALATVASSKQGQKTIGKLVSSAVTGWG
ncbi:unnamed protein product, partial [Meganyctiphanes norvegica]